MCIWKRYMRWNEPDKRHVYCCKGIQCQVVISSGKHFMSLKVKNKFIDKHSGWMNKICYSWKATWWMKNMADVFTSAKNGNNVKVRKVDFILSALGLVINVHYGVTMHRIDWCTSSLFLYWRKSEKLKRQFVNFVYNMIIKITSFWMTVNSDCNFKGL